MDYPSEIFYNATAPLQRSVSNYGDNLMALALRDRQRQEALTDMATRHQQAMELLGLQQQGLLSRQREENQAVQDRGMALLGERDLLGDVGDIEKRNAEREKLYATAAAYGFKVDPKASPEENEQKAGQVLQDKTVEGYKNLVGERNKVKNEIDELLTPAKVSDADLAKAMATDPVVAGVLSKDQITALGTGKATVNDFSLSKKERATVLEQADVIRTKLEATLNAEQQRKAMARVKELSNRHDELTTAIGLAQKAVPAHRLGEIFTGATGSKGSTSAADKKSGFLSDYKALMEGKGLKVTPNVPAPAPMITNDMLLGGPTMVNGQLVAPLRQPAPAPARNYNQQPLTEEERMRIQQILGVPRMNLPGANPAPLLTNPMSFMNPFQGQVPPPGINPQLPQLPPEIMAPEER